MITRKIYHYIIPSIACLLLSCTESTLFTSCSTNNYKTYYLDASNGSDTNDGLSENKAWKSLGKVQKVKLQPGDKLLLKRGEVFNGELEISAQGLPDKRITIGAYGDAPAKPCIMGHDISMYALRVYNSDYVTVQNLEIVNTGKQPLPKRTGVKVECTDYGVSHSIRLDGLTIRDVNGSLVKQEGGGSGLYIVNGGNQIHSRFDSLTIENCHILRCARNAMIWSGYYDRKNWFPSKHTLVRNNLIEEVPGDGIVPIGCDSTLIEYNVMRNCPDVLPMTEAAAGFWPWSCDNTIIQFNDVSGHKAPWDAQAYDCDYNCTNTVIQYNYSHGNYGGLVLVCDSGNERDYSLGNKNSIVRYNISIGDGIRPKETRQGMFSPNIHIAGRVENTLIERNIIHSNIKPADNIDRTMITSDNWDGYADNTSFTENIFYTAEKSKFDLTKSTRNYFNGNWYLGSYQQLPDDQEARTASEAYQTQVLDIDPNGYKGLYRLMESRTVEGETAYFVKKEAIEAFFNSLK